MRKTYGVRLADLQSILDNPQIKTHEYGFVIREFLANEALPVIKKKKKKLLTPELLNIITPKLAEAGYPSGSSPINDSYTLTLTIVKNINQSVKTIKTETVILP